MSYPVLDAEYPLLFRASGPIYKTRGEALRAPGPLYTHVKSGGVYRLLGHVKYAGDAAAELLDGRYMAVYEHLFPDDHEFYTRCTAEFREIVRTPNKGEHPRFQFETNKVVQTVHRIES